MNINKSDYLYINPSFTANLLQYGKAVRYLRNERIKGGFSVLKREVNLIRTGIRYHNVFKMMKDLGNYKPSHFRFSDSDRAGQLYNEGIKTFDIDKLEGIQYGIDVFKDLSMREILFLANYTMSYAVKRGCANMCAHCYENAIPARKSELSSMPFEDFKKIMDGFSKINKRINRVLGMKTKSSLVGNNPERINFPKNRELAAFFFDSDSINVIAEDINGKEHDFIEMAEITNNSTGQRILFDTAGWNPKNKILQQRAEKYAKYFSQPDIEKKFDNVNLSVNTFNPIYLKAYKLGYRPGEENDLANPSIKEGKILYDRYIERIANMIATLGLSDRANLLITYSTKYEPNMEGMYLSDLERILNDVEIRCNELLKEKNPTKEYTAKSKKIHKLIHRSFVREQDSDQSSPRCSYYGRYKTLFNSLNPEAPREDNKKATEIISDINALSPKEYKDFFNNYIAIVDTNGKIYYGLRETSLRSLGKEMKISTNGMKTPNINNLECRD